MTTKILTEKEEKDLNAMFNDPTVIEEINNQDMKVVQRDFVDSCVRFFNRKEEIKLQEELQEVRKKEFIAKNREETLEKYTNMFISVLFKNNDTFYEVDTLLTEYFTALYFQHTKQLKYYILVKVDSFIIYNFNENYFIDYKLKSPKFSFDFDISRYYHKNKGLEGVKLFYKHYIHDIIVKNDELSLLPDVSNNKTGDCDETGNVSELLQQYENHSSTRLFDL